MLTRLKATLGSLKELTLPDGTPRVEPIPPGYDDSDLAASRVRLQGAIARAPGPVYFAFPTGTPTQSTASKKMSISADGVLADTIFQAVADVEVGLWAIAQPVLP